MDIVKLIEPCIRALMCLLGILGNSWLAIRTLPSRRSQLRTNEALFLNLAVSNLITNVLVDVPDTMSEFAGGWFLGNIYCKMYWFFSDLSETSSIFSTLLISLFWYQKLVWSLKRGGARVALDSLRLIAPLLAGSWAVAVLFSFPNLIYGVLETKNQTAAKCIVEFPSQKAKEIYEIAYLTLANVVPISGILFASVQIVVTLLRHRNRIQGMAGGAKNIPPPRPSKPTPNAGTQVRAAKSKVAVASIFLVCWLTHLLSRIYNNINESSVLMDVASYAGSSYTSIIPYIFLYGIRKLTCSCRG
ncbi:tachykinin-like peptides receptor 86C [Paramormyrops kingsleyae]|uniref:tachykinin-like peptides receptor 86C n=1 Tax=Paramormyrops kingsleyae TaxID=1676925 RepID=UPI003B97C4EE